MVILNLIILYSICSGKVYIWLFMIVSVETVFVFNSQFTSLMWLVVLLQINLWNRLLHPNVIVLLIITLDVVSHLDPDRRPLFRAN